MVSALNVTYDEGSPPVESLLQDMAPSARAILDSAYLFRSQI
jgi:hypothetical protein